MTTMTAPPTTGRLRAAWSAAHASVAGVPRWARIAAYAVPFVVLPSSLWRIAGITFDLPLDGTLTTDRGAGDVPSWLPMPVYVVLLSILSELLACTALGLVARWGEVVPRWIPGLGGRRVPRLAAVVPATLGALTLTVLWTATVVAVAAQRTVRGDPLPAGHFLTTYDWHFVVLAVSYAPLLLWGPLLGAVTVAYWQRRRPVRQAL